MKQITVLVDNHPGAIADVTQVLADAQVNIETLDADGAEDHGVIILTVDHYDRALLALKDAAYQAISEDALVVRIEDRPGALAAIAARFKEANINLRSVHIIRRHETHALVAIVTENTDRARQLVRDELVS
jgi:hypothetical protein